MQEGSLAGSIFIVAIVIGALRAFQPAASINIDLYCSGNKNSHQEKLVFRKSVLFIVFQFSWLVISEAALAQLTQLEGYSHRFQYVHDDQTIDINLDPAIGRVNYIAAVKLTKYTRFYVETENGSRYLYAYYFPVYPGLFADYFKAVVTTAEYFSAASTSSDTSNNLPLIIKLPRGLLRGIDTQLQETRTWTTIDVSESSCDNCQSLRDIRINNPASQPESTWKIYNRCYSGKYTILEELSML
ncbi:hypothetical protein [Endozoicomonas euniceicola]|uniref:Uncharacterized protein n=1 Tax=Endozoicomonas euniceicola TaxID=1234143 RepID=A0ABY6GPD8_9GAMM|nr:hypothetical protein [Endozoicomonas euniceicola]UYM14620.1 hypothetical protein NX720_17210 [Endozoicomonas euniceicola]